MASNSETIDFSDLVIRTRRVVESNPVTETVNTFFNLGNSRNAAIYADTARRRLNSGHYFTQANAILNHSLELIGSNAFSGNTTAQFLAPDRLQECVNSGAKFAMVGSIINDVAQGVTYDPWTAIVLPALQYLIANGITPIVETEPGAVSSSSTAARAMIQRYNNLLREFSRNGQIIVFDVAPIVTDLTSTTFAFKSGFSSDGTHYTQRATVALGKAFASLLQNQLYLKTPRIVAGGEAVSTGVQLFTNPGFLIATGGTVGTGTTGTLPAGVTASNQDTGITCTASVVANTYGTNDIKLVGTATQAGRMRTILDLGSTNLVSGRNYRIYGEAEVEAGATGFGGIYLSTNVNFGTAYDYSDLYLDGTTNYVALTNVTAQKYFFEIKTQLADTTGTPVWITPQFICFFTGAGAATVYFRNLAVDLMPA